MSNFGELLMKKDISGINVTIPYKQDVIPFLDKLDPVAEAIGAVNTIVLEMVRKLVITQIISGLKKRFSKI